MEDKTFIEVVEQPSEQHIVVNGQEQVFRYVNYFGACHNCKTCLVSIGNAPLSSLVEYLDNVVNSGTDFGYCPRCGKKIYWLPTINMEFSNESEKSDSQ